MKYGFNTLLWSGQTDSSIYPILEMLKNIGYDGVELPIFSFDVKNYQDVGQKLKDIGLTGTSVTICLEDSNPISPDAKIRQAAVDRLKQAIDCAQAAGLTHIVGPIHSAIGSFSGSGRTQDEWNRAKETLSKAGDYAKQAGVTLVVEFLNRFECYFLNCSADAAQFCREVNHSHVKMMYDTFHANIEEKSIWNAVHSCKDQMVHIHISENDRSTPGEGDIKWDETFAAIKSSGYDGYLTIEAFGLALPEIAAATKIWRKMFPSEEYIARNGLAFMKSRMEGIGR
jgi:D-psicose/D-tagatose/L-ribulose 3-epimerase